MHLYRVKVRGDHARNLYKRSQNRCELAVEFSNPFRTHFSMADADHLCRFPGFV